MSVLRKLADEIQCSSDSDFEDTYAKKKATRKGKAKLQGKSEVTAKIATSRNKFEQPSTSSKIFTSDSSDDSDSEILSCTEKTTKEKSLIRKNLTKVSPDVVDESTTLADRILKRGDAFSSVADIHTKIEEYQQAVNAVYYVRDSTTIKSCRKKGVTKHINSSLGYYTLKFCCIRGGKHFKSNATGQRNSSSFRANCPAFVRFVLNGDGTRLIVAELNERHNHTCSKILFQHYPRVRSLTGEEKAKVKALLELGVNKKEIQKSISKETEKVVLLKDLSNIMAQPKG